MSECAAPRLALAALVLALGCAPNAVEAPGSKAGWARFRGPNGGGVASGAAIPARLDAGSLRWRTPVPPGRSSPVLSGSRVFLTGCEGDELATLCLDRATGALLWRRAVQRSRRGAYQEHNGPATPTAAVDGETVVAFFPDFGLVAYDHDGGERWRRALGPFESREGYGLASSPLLVGGTLVLALDQQGRSGLVALRAIDGATLWEVERPSTGESWTTPVVHAAGDGARELVHAGSLLLESVDLRTGARLRWTRGTFHEPIASAVVEDGVAYVVGFGPPRGEAAAGGALRGEDADGDGRIVLGEIAAWRQAPRRVEALFALADGDGDGGLDAEEQRALDAVSAHYLAAAGATPSLLAVRLAGSGDVTEGSYAWAARGKGLPTITTPLLLRGVLYCLSDDGGIVSKLDAATGALLAQERIAPLRGACFASPVAAGDRVLVVTHGGTAVVLDAAELAVLGVGELGGPCYATPALAGGRVYVRAAGALSCFGPE